MSPSITKASTVLTRSSALRRLLASKSYESFVRRSFHASSTLSGDALDMADTFARRHSKCNFLEIFCKRLSMTNFFYGKVSALRFYLSLYQTFTQKRLF